jgi:hypothetical protein
LVGGNNNASGILVNNLYGDGYALTQSSKGGNNTLIGGNDTGSGNMENNLYGAGFEILGSSNGGNNILIGGNNTGVGKLANNLYGDGAVGTYAGVVGTGKGGNETLYAGTARTVGGVTNTLTGDGAVMFGGKDLFVFEDHGSMTVGIYNSITDFSHSQGDKIEFSHVAGVGSFADLLFTQSGANTIITAGADQVTLLGVTATTLVAGDFKFG